MKRFSHDYSMPSEAESVLYSATRLMVNECYDTALKCINEARTILQQYLSQDNMIEEQEVESGYVRCQDVSDWMEEHRKTMDHYRSTQTVQNRMYMEIIRQSEEGLLREQRLKEENNRLRDRVVELERKLPKL